MVQYLDETKAKSARGNSEFQELVNMTPGELRHWLEEPDSQSSGWASDSGETIGHERRVQFTGENLTDRDGD